MCTANSGSKGRGFKRNTDATHPFALIVVGCKMLGWDICVTETDKDANLTGLVIGTKEFIDVFYEDEDKDNDE
jgi:hypothetical protein